MATEPTLETAHTERGEEYDEGEESDIYEVEVLCYSPLVCCMTVRTH